METLDIDFPKFPHFDSVKNEVDFVSFVWNGESGTVPIEWFYLLAEYVNTINGIEQYINTVYEKESSPP